MAWMEPTTIHLRDEQDRTVEQLAKASGATAKVDVMTRSMILRALIDAGIDAIEDERVEVTKDGEVVANGADVAALAEQVAQEVEGR
jgi:predicted DNA-binding protein